MPLPFVRQGSTAKLPAARETLETRRASLATSRKILDGIDADLDSIAMRTHAGEIDEQQADRELADVAERERVHTAAVDHLERTIALLEESIGQIERETALEEFETAAARVDALQKTATNASAAFAKSLRATVSAAGRLARDRRAVAEAVALATELHPDGSPDLPLRDEDEWLDDVELEQLLEVVEAGPVRPVADGVAAANRAEAARKRADNETINAVVAGLGGLLRPSMIAAEIDRLPEHLRERAWDRARKLNDEARRESEQRTEREREAAPQRVLR